MCHTVWRIRPNADVNRLTGNRRSHHGDVLKTATRLVEEGKLRAIVDPRHFTLDQAIEAHDAVQDRSANIKVVIDVI